MSIKHFKLGWKRCHLIECTSALTVEQTEEDCGWVHWREHKDEVARLKAEVERLRASSFVTAVPVEQYERLRKAGDAMAEELIGRYFGNRLVTEWNAAKEGKPSV